MSLTSIKDIDAGEDTLFVFGEGVQAPTTGAGNLEELGAGRPKVVMDQASLELLEGSKIDYTMELIGSQFKITDNPRASSSCGCGTSFDLKGDSGVGGWGI